MKIIPPLLVAAFFSGLVYLIGNQELDINEYKDFSNNILHSGCVEVIEDFNKVILENDGKISVFSEASINQKLGKCRYNMHKKTLIENANSDNPKNPYL